jgi:ubiquitin C-terminal hydrolase
MENKSLANSDISCLELIDITRTFLQKGDNKNALFYINLLLSLPLLEFNIKISTLTMASQVYFNLKDYTNSAKLAKRLLRYIKEEKNQIDSENVNTVIEGLTNCASSFIEEEKFLLSSMLFYEIKNLTDEYKTNITAELSSMIEQGFTVSLNSISGCLKNVQNSILDKRSDLNLIYIYFKNYDTNKITGESNVHIISSQWVGNLLPFIKYLIETNTEDIDLENVFFLNNVCLLYFPESQNDTDLKQDFLGSYPGPVNNYILLDEFDNWIDQQDSYTNVSVKAIKEKSDYYVISGDIYRIINGIFGVYYELERKAFGNEVEVNLAKVKTIFISEILRELHKHMIVSKVVQVSHNCTFKDLEQKYIRIFKNLIRKDEGEVDLKIYLYERKRSDKDIFELMLSFVNKDKSFKIAAKEIKKENRTIAELNIGSESFILVEIFPRSSISKPFIRLISDMISCSLCNSKVEESKRITCENCKQNIYCSEICRDNDTQHIEYHFKTISLFKKNYTLEDFINIPITDFIDVNTSKLGKVGLKNIGNSCFMNAALQCLSHCEILTKYFLSKMFYDDINKVNKNSTGGLVAKAFYGLIKEIWLNNNEVVIPWEFKQIFASFAKQFSGTEQPDSHEMLNFLIYKIHEDLNRISDRTEVSVKEKSNGETDEEAQMRIWNNFTQRENSIMTDLFFGLLKNTAKCPDCKHTTIGYDVYTSLSLDIPEFNNFSKVKFKVFLNNFNYNFFCIEMGNINKFTTIKQLKDRIKETQEYRNLEFNALLLKNRDFDKVLPDDELIYDYIYTRINFTDEYFIEYQIVFVEVPQTLKNKGDYVTFYIKPCELIETSSYMLFNTKEPHILTYPRAFSISKKKTLGDLYKEVFRYYRRVFEDIEMCSFETFYDNITDESYLDKEYEKYTKNDKIIDLYFHNNIPSYNSYIYSDPKCEYCKKSKCGMCKVNLPLHTSIHELYVMQQHPRDFVMIADFTKQKDRFYKFYNEFLDPKDPRNHLKSDINIYDCLEYFKREEKFEKTNMWMCPKCNKNKEAFKKVEIVTAPRYLILHLKRFKFKGYTSLIEMMNNKKNETFVDFPLDNFNISQYLIGPNKDNATYRLVSVTNHTGNLKTGHNYAVCKSGNSWIEFNDESVKDLDGAKFSENTYYMTYEKI